MTILYSSKGHLETIPILYKHGVCLGRCPLVMHKFFFVWSCFGPKIQTGLCLKELGRRETKDREAEMIKRGMDGCFLLLRVMDL